MQNNNIDTNDLVTVVTVTYNAEELLEETILSVVNQSYDNIEYIIIDGASTDKTVDIIKKYEDKISYWVSEADEGIYFAMNKAIEKASGKWINFMNAGDTFADNETVEYVMQYKDRNAELIYGDYQIKETGVVRKARDQSEWYTFMPFCHQTLFTQTYIMKDELFDTSFKLAADHNFIVKMYAAGKRFDYLQKTIAIFEAGGYAESNRLLMHIESLKVLLGNGASEDSIKKSTWYSVLSGEMCLEIKNKLNDKQAIIEDRDSRLAAQDETIRKQQIVIDKKQAMIEDRNSRIIARDKTIEKRKIVIDNKQAMVEDRNTRLEARDETIKKQQIVIDEKQEMIEERDSRLAEREELVKKQETVIDNKQVMVEDRNSRLAERDETIRKINHKELVLKNHLEMVLNTIENVATKSITSNPIQKYKTYKTMLIVFHSLRKYYK